MECQGSLDKTARNLGPYQVCDADRLASLPLVPALALFFLHPHPRGTLRPHAHVHGHDIDDFFLKL